MMNEIKFYFYRDDLEIILDRAFSLNKNLRRFELKYRSAIPLYRFRRLKELNKDLDLWLKIVYQNQKIKNIIEKLNEPMKKDLKYNKDLDKNKIEFIQLTNDGLHSLLYSLFYNSQDADIEFRDGSKNVKNYLMMHYIDTGKIEADVNFLNNLLHIENNTVLIQRIKALIMHDGMYGDINEFIMPKIPIYAKKYSWFKNVMNKILKNKNNKFSNEIKNYIKLVLNY